MRSSKEISSTEKETEMATRRCFADFVGGLLNLNPLERWNPYHAMQHPFITGKPFTGPFQPTLLPLLSSPNNLSVTSNHYQQQQQQQQQPQQKNQTVAVASTRSRPRSNTLSTLTFQDVPPQLQRLAAVSKSQATQPPGPASRRTVPDEAMSNNEGPALFDQRRNSHQLQLSQGNVPSATTPQQQNVQLSHNNNSPSSIPQIQTSQNLSAYMTNRRVSNPAGMNPYSKGVNGNTLPASLPTSTGFFYYNNNNNNNSNNNNNNTNNNTNNTNTNNKSNKNNNNNYPIMANTGRRNSRASSQLSISSNSNSNSNQHTNFINNVNQRRGSTSSYLNSSISSSFGTIHRIDEDVTMSSPSADETECEEEEDGEEDGDIFQNFEDGNEEELKFKIDQVTMEETGKRQRKKT